MRPQFIVIFFLVSYSLLAQQSFDFETGLQNNYTYGKLLDRDDTTLYCLSYFSINGIYPDLIEGRVVDKNTLAVLDTFVAWQRIGRQAYDVSQLKFQSIPLFGNVMIEAWHSQSKNVDGHVEFNLLGIDLKEDSLLFSISRPNRYVNCVEVVDDSLLYVVLSNTTSVINDSTFIEIYNFKGNLVKQNLYGLLELYGNHSTSIQQHPNKDSLLALFNMFYLDVNLINKYTLDTVKTIRFNKINHAFRTYSSFSNIRYKYLDSKGFTFYGTSTMVFGFDTLNTSLDEQAYFYKRNWNGDSIEIRNYGPKLTDNDASVAYFDSNTGTHFLVGRLPTSPVGITSAIYRQNVIYRSNQFGYDSIILFGQKNH